MVRQVVRGLNPYSTHCGAARAKTVLDPPDVGRVSLRKETLVLSVPLAANFHGPSITRPLDGTPMHALEDE